MTFAGFNIGVAAIQAVPGGHMTSITAELASCLPADLDNQVNVTVSIAFGKAWMSAYDLTGSISDAHHEHGGNVLVCFANAGQCGSAATDSGEA